MVERSIVTTQVVGKPDTFYLPETLLLVGNTSFRKWVFHHNPFQPK